METIYGMHKDRILEFRNKGLSYTKIAQELKYNYGLSYDEYVRMIFNCEQKYEICGIKSKIQEVDNINLFVDHNHVIKKIRGLLRHKCNSLLGYCGENIQNLKNAIIYLQERSNG